MAKSLSQVQQQIQELRAEADRLRKRETAGVIRRIKDAIEVYGLTAQDLGFTASGAAAPRRKATRAKAASPARKVAVKYKDGAGNTWTGRGLKPRWLTAALANGRKLEEFLV